MSLLFRKFSFFFALVFFGIGALLLGFVVFPVVQIFSKNSKNYKIRCAKIVHFLWRILVKYIEITGIIRVNADEKNSLIKNKIIVASHPSYIDILLLIALVPNSLCLAKNSILNNFVMKNIVKSLYITNDGSVEDFLKKSKLALDDGFNVIIFPTGKRVDEGEEVHIYKGAAQLAIESKYPIVPVKISTSEPFLTKNHSIFQIGEKTVEFVIKTQDEIVVENIKTVDMTEISLRNKICSIIKEKI